MANEDQGISGERLGIEAILSVSLWILVVLAAFSNERRTHHRGAAPVQLCGLRDRATVIRSPSTP
jgi:hypothetical protein